MVILCVRVSYTPHSVHVFCCGYIIVCPRFITRAPGITDFGSGGSELRRLLGGCAGALNVAAVAVLAGAAELATVPSETQTNNTTTSASSTGNRCITSCRNTTDTPPFLCMIVAQVTIYEPWSMHQALVCLHLWAKGPLMKLVSLCCHAETTNRTATSWFETSKPACKQ